MTLSIDKKKLLNIFDNQKIDIENKEIFEILNRSFLDDADDNICYSYEDISNLLANEGKAEVYKFKTHPNISIIDLNKEILKVINVKENVKGIILNFRIGSDFSIANIMDSIEDLYKNMNNDEYSIIWGTTVSKEMGNVEVTMILAL